MTDRRVNRGRHSAHLAALLLTAYLRLHRRRFSAGQRARDGSAERIKCNSEEAALDPDETGLTDPELSDSRRSLLDYSAII